MELIGYQVVSRDGKNNIPDDLYSFEVVSKRVADSYVKDNPGQWTKIPIYNGDIEEPTILDDSEFEF